VSPLVGVDFALSDPIQEDYGWGFWAHHGEDPFWIALGIIDDRPPEVAAQWIVSVTYDPGLNLVKRLFHRPDPHAFAELRDRVWRAIRSNNAITVLESLS
jgi:hypothetical protein